MKTLLLLSTYFPKKIYWLAHKILNIGYLNTANSLILNSTPKPHEMHIKKRIEFMIKVRNSGLEILKIPKKNITELNILFCVHNSLPYDKAGYAIRTEHIVTTLKKQGINLYIATRPGYPWDLQKHRELGDRDGFDTINGVDYIRLKDSEKIFKRGADTEYINVYADELEKIAIQNDVSVIHAHSNYFNALAAIETANRLQIPSVYEVRGLWHKTRVTLDANYKYAGMFEYEAVMEKEAVSAVDAVVTISEPLKKLIVSWGIDASKIHIIPNTVDVTDFTPKPKTKNLVDKYKLEGKTVIGFLGTLSSYEGLKELILSVNELIKEGLDIVLMIVGDGREKYNLEHLTKSKHIIFTGRVPFEEVKEYYALFDICPFPRNNVEICRYVPPLKILEAMAMEKAVIVSDVAPLLEIVEEGVNALVCKADNVESLKTVILKLYQDDLLRKSLGTEARKWVRIHRTSDSMGERYINLYDTFTKK